MKFKESPYYNKEFLGKHLYEYISYDDKLLTVQEYFETNDKEKEYIKKRKSKINDGFHYELEIYGNHYELNCQDYDSFLFLAFDKPVYIIGKYCTGIIAPEIIVKSSENSLLSCCVANKVIINNDYEGNYCIKDSKISSIYFYNQKVKFLSSKVENFYVFNKDLYFHQTSCFLNYHKIKCFGKCDDLKKKILTSERFENGIIHIE